ncbi:MAG TPA: M23 family metallopeptidase [Methylomirabilota bacterium]|nr:M23 family metallopeptidase [Methylomirabilota bacterium]
MEFKLLLPNPRRLYRRITDSQLPTRLIAHFTVVSLVGFASLAGLAHHQAETSDSVFPESGFLVSSVRGAAEQAAATAHPASADLGGPTEEHAATLNRAAPAVVPPASNEPLATPVAVDPDATPLPGPTQAIGQVSTAAVSAQGPSTRAPAPAPQPASGGLVWPVPGGSISQYFHAGHLALDIAAPYGTQVLSAQSGTVTWAGWRNNGGGYVITVDHGNGMQTSYNHLGGVWVSVGQYVGAGQAIGPIGCSGMCTGPHVHFEVVVNGVIDNPQRHF